MALMKQHKNEERMKSKTTALSVGYKKNEKISKNNATTKQTNLFFWYALPHRSSE